VEEKSLGRVSSLIDERCESERTSVVDYNICVERIGKHLEEEFFRKYGYRI